MKVKSESEVAQLCLTLHDPMDCSLAGSSIHGIYQAKVLEGVPLPSPKAKYSFSKKRHKWKFNQEKTKPRQRLGPGAFISLFHLINCIQNTWTKGIPLRLRNKKSNWQQQLLLLTELFSNLSVYQSKLETLLKRMFLDFILHRPTSTPQNFLFRILGWDLRICFSVKISSDAWMLLSGPHFENHCPRKKLQILSF